VEIAYPGGAGVGVITLTHAGGSNFSVWTLDASLEQLDLVVNTIGSYSGTVLDGLGASSLEINADGNWTIETRQITDVQHFAATISGTGDAVVFYEGPTTAATLSNDGASNFAVWAHTGADSDLVVNEIGPYSGTVRLPGPALLAITAEGAWAITAG
jgi:hypothetical protein